MVTNNSVDLKLYDSMTKAQQMAFDILLYGHIAITDYDYGANDTELAELDFD